ncbi:sigma-70 family RNA polymerase sigma factor [Streptomyces sp. 8N616]|uniref:sigma-70 family RNA polymerase sigma factor n=1 Tax=Streptomyces sp. 8N616 TaxID=3457414 RepID=UPI003FD5E664
MRSAQGHRPRDEVFIRALYETHGDVLLRFASRLLGGDTHRAEDVVQETLLRAWRHSGALDPTVETVRPWLFTVVRNLVIDGYRAREIRPAEFPVSMLLEHAVPDECERALTAQIVAEAMADLAQHHREVLVHVHYLGRSTARTAKELNIPPGTVKSRTYYAMRALRCALEARGVTA